MATNRQHVNLFVGAETGLVKGVNLHKRTWSNLNKVDQVDKSREIRAMTWGDDQQSQICCGLRDRTVLTYGIEEEEVLATDRFLGGEGSFTGLAKHEGNFLTCVESGLMKLWKPEEDDSIEINVGPGVSRMRQNSQQPHLVATGGKENDLKIWDLNKPDEAIFKAKNVRPDFLQLRVPVWVTDMCFIPDTQKIITCTGHHQVRIYDPSTPQRRPVFDTSFDDYPITAMSLVPGAKQVIVGNTHGKMAMLDLRKGGVVQVYKGFAGGIRCIECHADKPVVASCGLDRFLRVHDIHSNKLLFKMYLKSRLNCLLFASDWGDSEDEVDESEGKAADGEAQNEDEEDDDNDEIWDSMDVVKVKSSKSEDEIPVKKARTDTAVVKSSVKPASSNKTNKPNRKRKKQKGNS